MRGENQEAKQFSGVMNADFAQGIARNHARPPRALLFSRHILSRVQSQAFGKGLSEKESGLFYPRRLTTGRGITRITDAGPYILRSVGTEQTGAPSSLFSKSIPLPSARQEGQAFGKGLSEKESGLFYSRWLTTGRGITRIADAGPYILRSEEAEQTGAPSSLFLKSISLPTARQEGQAFGKGLSERGNTGADVPLTASASSQTLRKPDQRSSDALYPREPDTRRGESQIRTQEERASERPRIESSQAFFQKAYVSMPVRSGVFRGIAPRVTGEPPLVLRLAEQPGAGDIRVTSSQIYPRQGGEDVLQSSLVNDPGVVERKTLTPAGGRGMAPASPDGQDGTSAARDKLTVGAEPPLTAERSDAVIYRRTAGQMGGRSSPDPRPAATGQVDVLRRQVLSAPPVTSDAVARPAAVAGSGATRGVPSRSVLQHGTDNVVRIFRRYLGTSHDGLHEDGSADTRGSDVSLASGRPELSTPRNWIARKPDSQRASLSASGPSGLDERTVFSFLSINPRLLTSPPGGVPAIAGGSEVRRSEETGSFRAEPVELTHISSPQVQYAMLQRDSTPSMAEPGGDAGTATPTDSTAPPPPELEPERPEMDINRIAEEVYEIIEMRLRREKERRGYF